MHEHRLKLGQSGTLPDVPAEQRKQLHITKYAKNSALFSNCSGQQFSSYLSTYLLHTTFFGGGGVGKGKKRGPREKGERTKRETFKVSLEVKCSIYAHGKYRSCSFLFLFFFFFWKNPPFRVYKEHFVKRVR